MTTNSTEMTDKPEATAYCADVAARIERDRWLAASLAPRKARAALAVLYAFHGELAKTRDMVSEPMLGQIRLQWWRETIYGATSGAPRDQPVARALAPLIADGRLDPVELIALIDAREADLEDGFATTASFLAYLDATAGALNRLALGLIGVGSEAAHRAAVAIGRAHGIAGHLRSVAVNAARGRVILPADLLAAHGVGMASLLAGRPVAGLAPAARRLSAMAHDALNDARALRGGIPGAALGVLALARLTDVYLARLSGQRFELFSGQLEPAPVAAPWTIARVMVSRRF